jgi:hypothetical protein
LLRKYTFRFARKSTTPFINDLWRVSKANFTGKDSEELGPFYIDYICDSDKEISLMFTSYFFGWQNYAWPRPYLVVHLFGYA